MEEFLKLLETVLHVFEVYQSPQTFLVLVGLCFARLVSFFSIVPFFGGASVPPRVKVAMAMAFVVILYPSLEASVPANQALGFGPLGFIALLMKEVLVGYTLGFVASLIFEAVQVAGRIVDFQRGSTMGELYAPQLKAQVSEIGQFKLQLAIVLFITIGAHRMFIGALLGSYDFIPALAFPKFGAGWSPAAELITTMTANVLSIGLQLAAPALIALLLTDLFFGIINRVAPQVNVFFLSMPVKMLVGIMAILIILPMLAMRMEYFFGESYKAFEYAIRLGAVGN
ncbi:MAG: flagellar biosynthetic protein FliR [Acidobacteriota bacterium]|nr:flagellar biosynthetic protein FliR [Acidobacteriota bacterium]